MDSKTISYGLMINGAFLWWIASVLAICGINRVVVARLMLAGLLSFVLSFGAWMFHKDQR